MISRICPIFLVLGLLAGGQLCSVPARAQQNGGATGLETAIAERKALLTYRHGVALYKAGKYRQAVRYFQSAVRLDPNNARYRKDLAIARRQLRIEMIKRRRADIEHEQKRRGEESKAVREGTAETFDETEDNLTSTTSSTDSDAVHDFEAESDSPDSTPAGIDPAASGLPFADTELLGIPLLGIPTEAAEPEPKPAPPDQPRTPGTAGSTPPKPEGSDIFDDVLGSAKTPRPGVVSPALP